MTDKVQKIREEVERIQLYTQSEVLKQVLDYIDSLQEEPISEDKMTISKEWFEHCKKSWYNEGYIDGEYNRDRQFEESVSEDLGKVGSLKSLEYYPEKKTTNKTSKGVFDANMPRRKAYLRGFKDGAHAHKELIANKPVSEELEEEIGNYVKKNGYDGLDSIEEVKYIAQYFTKWQKLQDMGVTNKAQDVVADVLSSADNPLDAYATEMAFMMLPATLKESYHQTNRDRICDAVRLGAKWQKKQFEKNRLAACDAQTEEEAEIEQSFVTSIIEKEHRQPTFDDAIKYGMRLQRENMMANTADAMIGLPYENKDGGYTHLIDVPRPLPVGSNKIAIIFKED